MESWPYGGGGACQERWPSLALSDHLLSVTFLERKERWFVVIAFLPASLQDILYLATHLHPSVIIRAEDPTLYVECTPRILYWWKLLAIGGLLNLWFILCIHYQRETWEFLTWPFGCKEVIEYVNVHFGQLVISPSCHYICEFVKIIRPRLYRSIFPQWVIKRLLEEGPCNMSSILEVRVDVLVCIVPVHESTSWCRTRMCLQV